MDCKYTSLNGFFSQGPQVFFGEGSWTIPMDFVSSFLTAINERDIQVFWTSAAGVTWDRPHGNREYGRFASLGNYNSTDVGVQPNFFLYVLVKQIVRSWSPNHRYAIKSQIFNMDSSSSSNTVSTHSLFFFFNGFCLLNILSCFQ